MTILEVAMRPANPAHVYAIWRAARHFETKLRMCDSVLRELTDPEIAQAWSTLNNRLGRNAKARHRLAHTGSYSKVYAWDDDKEREEGDVNLVEYIDGGMTVKGVDQIAHGFTILEYDLHLFLRQMHEALFGRDLSQE